MHVVPAILESRVIRSWQHLCILYVVEGMLKANFSLKKDEKCTLILHRLQKIHHNETNNTFPFCKFRQKESPSNAKELLAFFYENFVCC